ncbi:uncharacterized protein LOC135815280 [Sycon ciliatum]|uniref:uncharacterized protein LOC135815280 n=1 Tax=Sycon ciliatum TaxID=27933 RepID=UPI0031F65A18
MAVHSGPVRSQDARPHSQCYHRMLSGSSSGTTESVALTTSGVAALSLNTGSARRRHPRSSHSSANSLLPATSGRSPCKTVSTAGHGCSSPAAVSSCSGRSLAVAEGCGVAMQGEGCVLVHCSSLSEGLAIARGGEAMLEQAKESLGHSGDKQAEYESMAVGCEVAVQGRDILHCDSVEPGDDHSRGSEHSESGKKPTDGHVNHDTKESMLGGRLNHYRDLVKGKNGDFYFAVGCKEAYCGPWLKVIKVKEPIVSSQKRPRQRPSTQARSCSVSFDHTTKSNGVVRDKAVAYGGTRITRARFHWE